MARLREIRQTLPLVITALTPDAIPNCLYKNWATCIQLQFNILTSLWELETHINIDSKTYLLTLTRETLLEQN